MRHTQERALDKKISALQETNASLRDRQQADTKAWGETINTLENRYNQEIQSLREAIDCLQGQQDRHKKHDEEIDSLKETVKSLHCLATQTESDNSRLHDEIAELRAQLDSRHQGEKSRRPHESRQKLQEPWQRLPRYDESSEDTYEETLLHQHENEEEEDVQFPPASAHGRILPQSLEQPHPRGVKRAHVGDAAEPPPSPPGRVAPAQAEDANDSPQPRRFTMSMGSRARAHHGDEVARREEERQARAENDAAARQREFVDYFKSMRGQYKADSYGTNQRAFVCRFINGIQDPVLSRWFQESLRAKFPDKVHDEKRSTRKAGGRIVTPTRDLNWEDIENVLKYTLWPSMTD